ncbi:MAG: hypothetical protein R3227_17660 [Reinekea sp.]|nr:hypothetical protein [Reinekea sp.]
MQPRSAIYQVRKGLLTTYLTVKVIFGGILLKLSDLLTLFKSAAKWLVASAMGIQQTPNVVIWKGIPSVLTIPAWENLDFDFWRKPTYVVPTLASIVRHKTRMLLDDQRVEVIPDARMAEWSLRGPLSRLVEDGGDVWTLNLNQVDSVHTDEQVFLRGPTLALDKVTGSPLSLTFEDGRQYTPADGALWSMAKLHFQAAATFLLPGRFHGNIHFGLPCVAAASLHQLPKTSVLRQLLAPHFRFTLRINNEALRVQRAQDRRKPYAPFPMDGEEFTRSIAEDVQERLLQPGFQTPPWSLKNADLPYNQFGRAYYDVIRDFVTDVFAYIDDAELHQWRVWVAQFIPGFDEPDAVDTLATLIWQVSVLHSADHYTMEHLMEADRYIFAKPHLPEPAKSIVRADMTAAMVVNLMCDAEDRYRSNVFSRTFVAGHQHWLWDNSMANIRYRFSSPELNSIAVEFQHALLKTEQKLQAKSLNLTPLKNVFQSICW